MSHSLSPSRLLFAYAALSVAQIALSANVVTSKFLISTLPSSLFLAIRFGMSSVLLGGLLLLTHTPIKDPQHVKLSAHDWFLGILQGLFAAFLFNVFFIWGLQYTTATASSIIGSTLPAIIAISAIFFLGERLSSNKILALLLAMLGILVINLDHWEPHSTSHHSYFGDTLVLISMLPEAWYSIVIRKLVRRITPLGAAFLANMVGLIGFILCSLPLLSSFNFSSLSLTQWGLILFSAITSVLFFWGWGWGLTLISASTAGLFGGIMPLATTFLAILFLGEMLHWYDMLGMLLVIFSILIGTGFLKRRRYVTAKSQPTFVQDS